ncbi:hypothetical protein NMY22_g4813 [Coprinellus aureogranulatus]|nr:hypothetical protein NMY22_g4813 [Coprinellus aureogranulatus]
MSPKGNGENGETLHKPRASPNGSGSVQPLPRSSVITGGSGKGLGPLLLMLPLLASVGTRLVDRETSYAVCSADSQSIYTVDATKPQVQCILLRGQRIEATGSMDDINKLRSWYGPSMITDTLQHLLRRETPIYFIPQGSVVVPGLSDSHAHILEYGEAQQLPLEGTRSIEGGGASGYLVVGVAHTAHTETVTRVRNFILSNPDILNDKTKWIRGGGWDHTNWPAGRMPRASDLDTDPVIKGRPVVLQSKDCHALWVSSEAMRGSLPFPNEVDGGVVLKDDNGDPSGLLLDNAQDLLNQPKPTEDDMQRRFMTTVRDAHRHGLTSIHDAGLDPSSLEFFKEEAKRGQLPIRLYVMHFFNETADYFGDTEKPTVSADNRMSVRSVKIFADGALRTGGAALHHHYHDNPSTNGLMRIDPNILYDRIPKFLRDGWQVIAEKILPDTRLSQNVHAIGDRANGIILDVFESTLQGVNVTALRPRLEHAQMMTDEDLKRLGKLGVIASVQPTHAFVNCLYGWKRARLTDCYCDTSISDMWYAEDRLGPDRVRALYAFRSILDNGARLTLGSDFPVESMNPLSGFYAAVSRLSPNGDSPHGPGGWFPEQRLTREEALKGNPTFSHLPCRAQSYPGMTIDPAYASFTENILGSLEVGKLADFVVLSKDIMTVPVSEILSTEVLATVIDGKVVHGHL